MKRIRLMGVAVVVMMFGLLAMAICRTGEPRYQGRTLTEWIKIGNAAQDRFMANPDADHARPESDPGLQRARRAFKHMAPEAIPLLLSWVQAKDSPAKVRVMIFFDEHPWLLVRLLAAEDRNDAAQLGFMLLGNEARPAWPV